MRKVFIHKYNDIISLDNLLLAWEEFIKGKRNRKDVQEFQHRLMENIISLYWDLKNGTYKHSEVEFKHQIKVLVFSLGGLRKFSARSIVAEIYMIFLLTISITGFSSLSHLSVVT